MNVLENLQPKEVFHYFEEISRIPRASYKEKLISDYCVAFAKKRDLEVYQDSLYNVIIIKEASKGYEDVEPIILQGHLDMVCEKEPESDINFDIDPIRLMIEGDNITADGTTLGGDDGIAVAYALAILDSTTIAHPRLEVIFTVCEEVGMDGATGIDVSMLKGKRLLNLDSEEEGYMLVSCAGGCTTTCSLPISYEEKSGVIANLKVTGLIGGHSGGEIHKGRANSNLIAGRFLLNLAEKLEFSLISIEGGTKDNAIPRETVFEIVLREEDTKIFADEVFGFCEILRQEYASSDPNVTMQCVLLKESLKKVLTKETLTKSLLLLNHLPAGIIRMSMDIEDLVETSLNMGILRIVDDKMEMVYSVRSSVKTQKELLITKLRTLTEYVGGTIRIHGDYPAWEYKKESIFRDKVVDIFERMYCKKPIIQAIHAGLECGILSNKIKDLDGVSIGPDMESIHTTEEKLSISSTKRVWEYVLEVLKEK